MKTTRILALPAIAAASLLALTGCFQLPPVGGNTGGNTGGTTTEPSTDTGQTDGGETDGGTAADDLAGTSWSGDLGPGFATFDFTLNQDGTIDISTWNEGSGFDSPGDTWTGDSSDLTMVITDLRDQDGSESFDVTFNGTAADGSMNLTGEGPDGSWTLTATEG